MKNKIEKLFLIFTGVFILNFDYADQKNLVIERFNRKREICLLHLEKKDRPSFVRDCIYEDNFDFSDEFRNINLSKDDILKNQNILHESVLYVLKNGVIGNSNSLKNEKNITRTQISLWNPRKKYNSGDYPTIIFEGFKNDFYITGIFYTKL